MKAREYSSEWRWQRWKFRCFNRRNKNCDECATQVNSALHPSGAAKSSTSFGWGIGRNVTAAGWQVTLCDPIWHVISRSGEVKFHELLYSYFMITTARINQLFATHYVYFIVQLDCDHTGDQDVHFTLKPCWCLIQWCYF